VLERGSATCFTRERYLEEEYQKVGMKKEVVHPKVVERGIDGVPGGGFHCHTVAIVKDTSYNRDTEARLIHVPLAFDLTHFILPPSKIGYSGSFTAARSAPERRPYLLKLC